MLCGENLKEVRNRILLPNPGGVGALLEKTRPPHMQQSITCHILLLLKCQERGPDAEGSDVEWQAV